MCLTNGCGLNEGTYHSFPNGNLDLMCEGTIAALGVNPGGPPPGQSRRADLPQSTNRSRDYQRHP